MIVNAALARVARLRVTRTFILILRNLRIIRKNVINVKNGGLLWRQEGEGKKHNITSLIFIPECTKCEMK